MVGLVKEVNVFFQTLYCFSVIFVNTSIEEGNLPYAFKLKEVLSEAVIILEEREMPDGSFIFYEPKKTMPFTGWRKAYWKNGKVRFLEQYKDGSLDGEFIYWWENGNISQNKKMKNGKAHGLWASWFKNGQPELEQMVAHGKLCGPAKRWYLNGQKKDESMYRNGRIVSISVWKPNGQKCPDTNIDNGNGIWVRYKDDGSENWRSKYRNGLFVLN